MLNSFLKISGGVLNHIWTSAFAFGTEYLLKICHGYMQDASHSLEDYLWYYDYEEAGFLVDAFTDIVSGLLDIKVANIIGTNSLMQGGTNKLTEYFTPSSLVINSAVADEVLLQNNNQSNIASSSCWNTFTTSVSEVWSAILTPFQFVGNQISQGLKWVSDASGFN